MAGVNRRSFFGALVALPAAVKAGKLARVRPRLVSFNDVLKRYYSPTFSANVSMPRSPAGRVEFISRMVADGIIAPGEAV